MAATLQMAQHHDAAKVADVQGIGRWVGAQVSRNHVALQILFRSRHDLCQHTTPFQLFNEILYHVFSN